MTNVNHALELHTMGEGMSNYTIIGTHSHIASCKHAKGPEAKHIQMTIFLTTNKAQNIPTLQQWHV